MSRPRVETITAADIERMRTEVPARLLPADEKTSCLALIEELSRVLDQGGGYVHAKINGGRVPVVFRVLPNAP